MLFLFPLRSACERSATAIHLGTPNESRITSEKIGSLHNKYERYYGPVGVRATIVTAGYCTHAELISGHALASCYSCCVHSLTGLC